MFCCLSFKDPVDVPGVVLMLNTDPLPCWNAQTRSAGACQASAFNTNIFNERTEHTPGVRP